jgi:lipopolysaccharide heptosyltransferase II
MDRYIGIPLCFLFSVLAKLRRRKKVSYKNILVIKFGMLGDAILLMPALRALRENLPQAHLMVMCSQANAAVFQNCPYVDELKVVDFAELVNPASLLRLISTLKKRGLDLAIDFEQWSRVSALIGFFSGAKTRVGFKTALQHRHLLFNIPVQHIRSQHEVECFLDLLKSLQIQAQNKELLLWPTAANKKEADLLLESMKIDSDFIVLHAQVPESGWQRQWPMENLAQVAQWLIKKYNFKVLIIATQKGKEEAERLNALLESRAQVITGVDLLTVYETLARAKLVITNNSGFMHLAASAKAPVVALHGPTSAAKWGPWGKNNLVIKSRLSCSPCLYLGYEYGCHTNRCMRDIKPQEVLEKIDDFLRKLTARRI